MKFLGLFLLLVLSVTACKESSSSSNTTTDTPVVESCPMTSTALSSFASGNKTTLPHLQVSSAERISLSETATSGVYLSTTSTVTIPSNLISFQIVALGSQGVKMKKAVSANGTDWLATGTPLGKKRGYRYVSVFQSPLYSGMDVTAGSWSYQLEAYSSSAEIVIGTRTGSVSSTPSLTIQPYITGKKYSASDLEATFTKIKSIFSNANVSAIIQNPIFYTCDRYRSLPSNFFNSNVKEMISKGQEAVVNIYFIEDLTSSGGSVLGIAPGIPGPMGFKSAWNGVLVGLSAHAYSNGTFDEDLLAETAVHEVGHWLGLYHTTERNGQTFDVLSDTAECPSSRDQNNSGTVSAEECAGLGNTNIMFWTPGSSVRQTTFSSEQKRVFQHAPIAE